MSGTSIISQIVSKVAVKLSGQQFLPCFILSRNPAVLVTYWTDLLASLGDIAAPLPSGRNSYILVQFGWHKETDQKMLPVAEQTAEITASYPNLKLIFLCNSEKEVELCRQFELNGVFCHQNAFLDETRYPIIGNTEKKYDAVYLARISPFKRHALAAKVEKLKLIGDYRPQEEDYYHEVMKTLPHADWIRKVPAFDVPKHFAEAHVGLCLSAEEGAMFASAEYLLCGLPVVSTKNKGGRDALFDAAHTIVPEDTPVAVTTAVQELKSRSIDPEEIRRSILRKMESHRQTLIDTVQGLFDAENEPRRFSNDWKMLFSHKLGLRTNLPLKIQFSCILRKGMKL